LTLPIFYNNSVKEQPTSTLFGAQNLR